MAIFQCAKCGCAENSRFGTYNTRTFPELYDWTGLEQYKFKALCSVCSPKFFANGGRTKYGEWHGRFERTFLPIDEFFTNADSNLQHKKTGSTNYKEYSIPPPPTIH